MFVDWFDSGTGMSRVPSVWQEMNALLGALERSDRPAHTGAPQLSVETDEEKLVLTLLAPGVRSEDIDVSVTGRRLEITASREPTAPEGFRLVRQERRAWRVERSLELPFDVMADQAEAQLVNGVFRLVLPRVPKANPVKIPVRTEVQAESLTAPNGIPLEVPENPERGDFRRNGIPRITAEEG